MVLADFLKIQALSSQAQSQFNRPEIQEVSDHSRYAASLAFSVTLSFGITQPGNYFYARASAEK